MRFLHSLEFDKGPKNIYLVCTHTWVRTGRASAQILDTSGAGDITVLLGWVVEVE